VPWRSFPQHHDSSAALTRRANDLVALPGPARRKPSRSRSDPRRSRAARQRSRTTHTVDLCRVPPSLRLSESEYGRTLDRVARRLGASFPSSVPCKLVIYMGRVGIEPTTCGLKVRTAHQQAQPAPCRHKHLAVQAGAAMRRLAAASVPPVCHGVGANSLCANGRGEYACCP
jgi:hypothetical protein